jgi:hypothetical protein
MLPAQANGARSAPTTSRVVPDDDAALVLTEMATACRVAPCSLLLARLLRCRGHARALLPVPRILRPVQVAAGLDERGLAYCVPSLAA